MRVFAPKIACCLLSLSCCFLSSCGSGNIESTVAPTNLTTEDDSQGKAKITAQEDAINVENTDKYKAKNDEGVDLFSDYDTTTTLCADAMSEFFFAKRDEKAADFSKYIKNKNLINYMNYRLSVFPHSYSIGNDCRFFVTQVDFNNNNVYVNGFFASYASSNSISMEGKTHFIVENAGGSLVISEWYWEGKDSPDPQLRGDFSVENNLGFWEDEAKYEIVLKEIS